MPINTTSLSGRLVRPVELRYSEGGKAWATFTLATDTGWGDKKSTLFLDCKCFGGGAEVLEKYTDQGVKLSVAGSLQQENWEKDGQKRSKVVLMVRDFELPAKGDGQSTSSADTAQHSFNDDDIPF